MIYILMILFGVLSKFFIIFLIILSLINLPSDIGALRAGLIKFRFNLWNSYGGLLAYIAYNFLYSTIVSLFEVPVVIGFFLSLVFVIFPIVFIKQYIIYKKGVEDA